MDSELAVSLGALGSPAVPCMAQACCERVPLPHKPQNPRRQPVPKSRYCRLRLSPGATTAWQ